MRIHRFNLETDLGKEYSIKLLPNIDNLKEPIRYIEKYYENGKEITKQEYWKERTNNSKAFKIEKYVSFALLNGEYCILSFSRTLHKFYKYAMDGCYYKINPSAPDEVAVYYSKFDFADFRESGDYEEMKLNNTLHLIEKVVISKEPILLSDIKHDWSIKFSINEKHGFMLYDNIRIEKDSKNLVWDGKEETKDDVQTFLNNKDLVLEDFSL